MASEDTLLQKLESVSTTFLFKIKNWRNLEVRRTLWKSEISVFYCREIKIGFEMYYSVKGSYHCILLPSKSLPKDFIQHYKFSLNGKHNTESLVKSKFAQNNEEITSFCVWSHEELQENFRNEDSLTVRCILTVGKHNETNSDVDNGVQTNDMTVKDTSSQTSIVCTQDASLNTYPLEESVEMIPKKFLATLSSDFESLYNDKTNTDFVLKASDDVIFPVHRAVLSARSDVFAAMFQHDTLENSKGEADIQDIDGDTLRNLLNYVYCGKITLTSDTAVSIFIAADKYALLELREEALQFLLRNLTIRNICNAAHVANMHADDSLEGRVLHFIQDNMQEILNSREWQKLSAEKPSLVIKILSSVCLASETK